MSLRYAPAVFALDHLPFVRPPVIDAAPRPARAVPTDVASATDPDADASPETIQAQWRAAWAAAGARLAEASPDEAPVAGAGAWTLDGTAAAAPADPWAAAEPWPAHARRFDPDAAAPADAPHPDAGLDPDPITARRARLWGAVRADYLAGEPAAVVAERHGVSLSALRTRARQEGWRRADLPEPMWPEPERRPQEAPYDPAAPLPDPRALAEDALRRAAHAQAHDRPLEAARWLRLAQGHLRLAGLLQRSEALDAEADARRRSDAHAECMQLLARRARRAGARPPLSLDDQLEPHEAACAAAAEQAAAAGAPPPPPGALRLPALLALLAELRRADAAHAPGHAPGHAAPRDADPLAAAPFAPSAPSAPSAPRPEDTDAPPQPLPRVTAHGEKVWA